MSFEPRHVVSAFNGKDTVLAYSGDRVGVEVEKIGEIKLISGGIVACDPFICQDVGPFTRTVAPDSYPVRLAVARIPIEHPKVQFDRRIAYAGIFFSELPAESWEMALLPSQDATDLAPGYYFGYPVDSATGCFADVGAMDRIDAEMERNSNYLFNVLNLSDRTYIYTRSWDSITPPEGGGNIFIFVSGYGDGSYPSYFGLDAQGTPSCLVTDFLVLGGKADEETESDAPD